MIGAGSAMFTQGIVTDWLRRRTRDDWEFALVDINPEILTATEKMVRRYMLTTDYPAKVTATTDRREVLQGATLIVTTIGVGSRRAWEQDVFVPRKFGIFEPVGDSVMPGGVSRAMRMIPPMLDIARDAHKLCPTARFINYSNPMTAITRAIRKHTPVAATGLCIGTEDTLRYLARLAEVPMESVSATWVGVNHCTWITDFRSDGKDMWPKLRQKVAQMRAADRVSQPFSWELFDEFGAHPAPGDRHTTEFFYNRFAEGKYRGKTLGVDVFSVERTIANGDRIYAQTIDLAKGEGPIPAERLKTTSGEHMQMLDIFDSVEHDRRRWFSMNVPNNGTVPNLPKDAVLELPGVAGADGLVPLPQDDAPPRLAAFILRRCAAAEAAVEAAVTGDRKLLVEAMIIDGGVYDYATASKLTDELLKTHKQHLPQFA
ncbi:MAG TPA: hypothetical protein VN428_03350 [Bryobacteraceae bacterium]|nr:hypothetical protein [Bryobacteraceae bacterium]